MKSALTVFASLSLALLGLLPGPNAYADYVVKFERVPTAAELQLLRQSPGIQGVESFLSVDRSPLASSVRISSKWELREFTQVLKRIPRLRSVRVEPIPSFDVQSLEIPSSAKAPSNDLLSTYQWSLENQGHTLLRAIDDLHTQTIRGSQGEDIHWKNFPIAIEPKLTRDLVIAVVDSGLATTHEDLKGVSVAGRNFTTPTLEGDTNLSDTLKHGTHIAGILAAIPDNQLGIRGVSKRIKIMPLKVLFKQRASDPAPARAFADRVAQSILFAVKNKADAINLSLGWPRSMDTAYVREAVQFAIEAGVPVIAAAGNNSHDQTQFPCAYSGVICVGATSVDGSPTPFTNFGPQVDLAAPGEFILSTIPILIKPELYRLKGYDFMSGTSQSAPFVTAAAALIRGLYPNDSMNRLKARLYSSARSSNGQAVRYGKLSLEEALTREPLELVQVDVKEFDTISYHLADGSFTHEIRIQNLTPITAPVEIELQVRSNEQVLGEAKTSIGIRVENRPETLSISGRIIDRNLPAEGTLRAITRYADGRVETIDKSFTWSRDLSDSAEIQKISFDPSIPKSLIGDFQHGRILPALQTLASADRPTYYSVERPETGPQRVHVFVQTSDRYTAVSATPITLPEKTVFFGIRQIDLDLDGTSDYLIGGLKKAETETFLYCYYDASLAPLYGTLENSCFELAIDDQFVRLATNSPEDPLTRLFQLDQFSFQKGEKNGRTVLLPLFQGMGLSPVIDFPRDVWGEKINSPTRQLYWLEQTGVGNALRLRSLRSQRFKEFSIDGTLDLFALVPQSRQEAALGKFRAYFRKREGALVSVRSFQGQLHPIDGIQGDWKTLGDDEASILAMSVFPVISMDSQGFTRQSDLAFTDIYSPRLALTRSRDAWIRYDHPFNLDDVLTVSAHYSTPESFTTIYFSKNQRIAVERNRATGQIRSSQAPLIRYSFLPGFLFGELYYPISIRDQGREIPALFIDRSQIQSESIAVLPIADGEWKSRAHLNLAIPSGCRIVDPVRVPSRSDPAGAYVLRLLCIENEVFHLKQIPLSLDQSLLVPRST